MATQSAVIETVGLEVKFGRDVVLRGIDFRVGEREIVTLMGVSGCGKSTLLRAIMGLIPVSGGEIYIEGERTDKISDGKMNRVRKKMGMVFQEGALFDSMNVRENVAFALRRHTKMKEKEIREVVRERLEAVGLEDVEEKMPSELSGGMQRRVGIARALALSPRILLYDEPTTGLDPLLTATVVDLILKMRQRYGTTSVVVTHDVAAAERVSDRIAMIHEGGLIAEGKMADLEKSSDPHIRKFLTAMRNDRPPQGGS
jgi:phospholipid/cholesterol/gamma-HCH transport system ATP-binding protein